MATFIVVLTVLVLFGISWMNYDAGLTDQALMYAASGLLIGLSVLVYTKVIKPFHDRLSRDKLLLWIFENEEKIKLKIGFYGSTNVTPETVLTRYAVVYSFVFFTQRTYTNFVIAGSFHSLIVGVMAFITNMLAGWWALPWGPIYTAIALYDNFFKRETLTVREVLEIAAEENQDLEAALD